jgi:16S rRNA (uracil1498-N3)-methyltransferase
MSLRRALIPANEWPKPGASALIPEEEAHHLVKVLRLEHDAEIEVFDGEGNAELGRLQVLSKSKIAWQREVPAKKAPTASFEKPTAVHLAIAALKGEAMEWVVEKAVELNIESLTPLLSQRSQLKSGHKSPADLQVRWQRIADQALKQCGRTTRLRVEKPVSLETFLEHADSESPLFFADEASVHDTTSVAPELLKALQSLKFFPANLGLLIGPEGGFTNAERDSIRAARQAKRISLGPLILRAETAAILAMGLAVAVKRDQDKGK